MTSLVTLRFINFNTSIRSFHIFTSTLSYLWDVCLRVMQDWVSGLRSLILRTSHVTRAGNEWTVASSGRESIKPVAPWKLCRWPSPWRPTFFYQKSTLSCTFLEPSMYGNWCQFLYVCNGLLGKRLSLHLMACTVDYMLSIWHLHSCCNTCSRCCRMCSEDHIQYGLVWLLNRKDCLVIKFIYSFKVKK